MFPAPSDDCSDESFTPATASNMIRTPHSVIASICDLSSFSDGLIEDLRDTLAAAAQRARESTEAQIRSIENCGRLRLRGMMELAHLEDCLTNAAAADRLADQVVIQALYARFEIRLKQLVTAGIPGVRRHSLFRWSEVHRQLGIIGIDLSALPACADVNELRVLNNAIKHEGCVSEELARLGYPLGQPIPLSGSYGRFRSACCDFIAGLAAALLRYHDPSGTLTRKPAAEKWFFYGTEVSF